MNPLEQRILRVNRIPKITGEPPFNYEDLIDIEAKISPLLVARERARVQALEILNISQDADDLEGLFREKNLPLPSAYAVFTTGHVPGENAIKLGTLGENIFQNFPSPETKGHQGEVYALPFADGLSMLGFFGRAHPNEYFGHPYGAIIVAHQLRVVKELIRRERADLGIDPPVFLSYLAGAAEGHALHIGRTGLILSDTEKTNVLHPGHGPAVLLDEFLGTHFQGKFESTSDETLGRIFVDKIHENGLVIQPVAVAGTPGTTEFQNPEETLEWKKTVEMGREYATGRYAETIFGQGSRHFLTAAFGMGITFEQATLRQRFLPEEIPVKKIGMLIITDIVGIKGSKDVAHQSNIEAAVRSAPLYQTPLLQALSEYVNTSEFNIGKQKDYSIRAKLGVL